MPIHLHLQSTSPTEDCYVELCVPKTMIKATRYGSGSTRLKPSSCDSTAGSPSMTADPVLNVDRRWTSKESRAVATTIWTSQNTFNVGPRKLLLPTPLWSRLRTGVELRA